MNPSDPQTWHTVLIGGGIALALSFVLYYLPTKWLRIPAVLIAVLGGAAVGLGAGIFAVRGAGYQFTEPESTTGNMGQMLANNPAPPPPPSSRIHLVVLVNALERLVDQPVALTLSPADRSAIATQLKGLDKSEEIAEADAGAKLDAILKVVEKDRKALEAIGYRWPTPDGKAPAKGGFGGTPKDGPNPFRQGPDGERLKTLQGRLEKK